MSPALPRGHYERSRVLNMLIANQKGRRIEASEAEKGLGYWCPNCKDGVVLKKGRIVAHHFAHKPPVKCIWGKGETHAHREAKRLFQEEFIRRGLRAEVEHEVASLPDDRRADVVVWSPGGERFALELQHTPIDYENLEHRTRSYIRAGVRVVWVPFLRPKMFEEAVPIGPKKDGDFLIEKYAARPLEKWVHGFNFGEYWMYDPSRKALWKAKLAKHEIHAKVSVWYDADGNENHTGGYTKTSKRWRELTLWGPYRLDQVRIETVSRPATEMGNHRYPGGKVGKFVECP